MMHAGSNRNSSPNRILLVIGGTLSGLIIALFVWQYSVYRDEARVLDQAAAKAEKTHAQVLKGLKSLSVKDLEKQLSDITREMQEINRRFPSKEKFDFRRMTSTVYRIGENRQIRWDIIDKKFISRDFYEEGRFTWRASGPLQDIKKALKQVDEAFTLIQWNTLCLVSKKTTDSPPVLKFTFSLFFETWKPETPLKAGRPPALSGDIRTNTWLPPFSIWIGKRKKDLKDLEDQIKADPGMETKQALFEQIRALKILSKKKETVIEHISGRLPSLETVMADIHECPRPPEEKQENEEK
jgi:hypothetical protein